MHEISPLHRNRHVHPLKSTVPKSENQKSEYLRIDEKPLGKVRKQYDLLSGVSTDLYRKCKNHTHHHTQEYVLCFLISSDTQRNLQCLETINSTLHLFLRSLQQSDPCLPLIQGACSEITTHFYDIQIQH